MLNKMMAVSMTVVVMAFLPGCGPSAGTAGNGGNEGGAAVDEHAEEHAHPTEGPHGGHLIELGEEEYHAELTHDEATHTVSVYLLDAEGQNPASADEAEIKLQLFQEGQFVDYLLQATEGTSAFALVDEALCDALLHDEEVRGRLHVTLAGTPYTGLIEHQAHDHAGHDHGDH